MFEKTKEIMDKFECYDKKWNPTKDEASEMNIFFNTYVFDMAKAMYSEIPEMYKIAKMICIMDDSLKVQIEVK